MTREMEHTDFTNAGGLDFADFLQGDHATHGFTALNDPSATPQDFAMTHSATVSPQDLLLDFQTSAPNSNSFTNLTTPSMYDGSPDLGDSFDASPMWGAPEAGKDEWYSLFPEGNKNASVNHTNHEELASSTESLAMERTESGSTDNKTDILHRLSLTAGVAKSSRRATRALGPIEVDDCDEQAVKRKKNTLAARKSRQKKRDVEDGLRVALAEAISERDRWRDMAISKGAPHTLSG